MRFKGAESRTQLGKASRSGLKRFRRELEQLRRFLGEDYLERIKGRVQDFRSEIIIAVENIKNDAQ